ncbi:hypothetical protein [Pectinatus brassicae]|uniref:Beta-xylosidase n=2 Tax=Pectinatus brassicae TaxID=862415 RepID=A0A840US62_9FIRM|nr:beta-xylosidase [Pectinatus brassicae]
MKVFMYKFARIVSFYPDHYSKTAGLGLYYDGDNWVYIHLKPNNTEDKIILACTHATVGCS